MRAFSLVLAVATFAVSGKAGVVIQEEHPIDWYDCSGEADGNYVHPYDCTRFISCSGGIASQRDCANCDIDPVRCPDGRLVYDPSVDRCEWADTTTCSASPRPSTEPPTVVPSSERPSSTTTEASSSTSDDSDRLSNHLRLLLKIQTGRRFVRSQKNA
ncbi:Chondroitin proteoglycan-2 [Orchesella cincta]|uniref:Chondroitin proteoglycan-2 n=1 Tax=Orchesella cincta TaxID=48709 RepID=A0A1D2M683_ORCCI|nr:Chondroitin proteoglycan-2 [Orchesella cincta]